jgi:hypothetical protein
MYKATNRANMLALYNALNNCPIRRARQVNEENGSGHEGHRPEKV